MTYPLPFSVYIELQTSLFNGLEFSLWAMIYITL